MNPNIWGSTLWIFLHLLTFEYHIDKKEDYKNFFKNLSNMLPCIDCQNEYKKYMTDEKIEYILQSKENCMKGIWKFHNSVNKRLNKKILEYDKFIEIYKKINKIKKFNGNNLIKENELLKLIIILLVIIILLYLISKLFFKVSLV